MGILDPLHRCCCIFLVSTNFYHCVSIKFHKRRSASALLGAYLNIDEDYNKNSKKIGLNTFEEDVTVDDVVAQLISSQKWSDRLYALFKSMDIDCDGLLNELEFITGITRIDPRLSHEEAEVLFHETDSGRRGTMNYNDFVNFLKSTKINSVFLWLMQVSRLNLILMMYASNIWLRYLIAKAIIRDVET